MKSLLLDTMQLATKHSEEGNLSLAEQVLDDVFAQRERFLQEISSQQHFTLRQAAALSCVCYTLLTRQYIRLGLFASNKGDTPAEYFAYQNASRCVEKAIKMFSYCQSPYTDAENNMFIQLSFDLSYVAATQGRVADVKRHLQQCIDTRATDVQAVNTQSAARNCLRNIRVTETVNTSGQILKTLKDFLI